MGFSENSNQDTFFTNEMIEKLAQDAKKQRQAEIDRPKIKSEKIYNQEIADLEEPINELIRQLRYNLESGKYDLVIGEDASGRIPALIVKKVVDHIYKSHGHNQPQLKFIAGFQTNISYGLDNADFENLDESEQNDLKAKIETLKNDFSGYKGTKALLVTDYIFQGKSSASIKSILQDIGVELDIATVKSSHPITGADEYDTFTGSTEKTNHREPSIIYHYNLGGVHKDPNQPYAERHNKNNNLTEARSDVENVVNNIIKRYDSEK